ncbi:MAG: PQQ-binding-like beta-propeller repeat protein [Candidatus Bathyarchaeota archaeon]|nr:PQQ-binding-like beta-propeller repeat protein [Candidatus Bathyarchaeota archaeon]
MTIKFEKLKIQRKQKVFAIALFLLLAISAFTVLIPVADAHTPAWNIPTYAYLSLSPNPVGVNQQTTLVFWLNQVPPTAAGYAGDRWVFTVEVTKPDGAKETLGTFTSDPVGGGYALYTPDQTGTYTFTLEFPGQIMTGDTGTGILNTKDMSGNTTPYLNDTYLSSNATATLTVQQDQISYLPSTPLPTEYWTRPINGQNTQWTKIASNWLSGNQIVGRVQPDGIAPNTPHVLWSKPYVFGGVVGGETTSPINGVTFYDGTSYECRFLNPIIINGRLYYELPLSDQPLGGGYVCVDLRTGEELWTQNITGITFGQLFDYESQNQHGVIPNGYLWRSAGSTWEAYDPLTGKWLFTLTNVPSTGTTVYGPNGEILKYILNADGKWLALWNNTAAHELTGSTDPTDYTSTNYYQWRPVGKTVDASNAYSWNVTIPWLPAGATILSATGDTLLGMNGSFPTIGGWEPYTMWAMSLEPTSLGSLLWMQTYQPPAGNVSLRFARVDLETRIFTLWDKEDRQSLGYSLDDGNLLWTTQSETPWNYYNSGGFGSMLPTVLAYGKLYSSGYGGDLYCYDQKDGSLLWHYFANSGLETPYGGYPLIIVTVADGKIYLTTSEHSTGAPYWKGAKLRCINATDGTEIWAVGSPGDSQPTTAGDAIADGYLVAIDCYSNQLYCYGRGPTETTVTAPNMGVPLGNSVLIQGRITDTAAGTNQNEQAKRFPHGVPAVSDNYMGAWMEYVYMQKPKPTDTVGVPVHLTATDPNGNYQDIGYATSNALGNYAIDWTPPVPGIYTVTATFEGSESYYRSEAGTSFVVSETAAQAVIVPTQPPAETAAPTVSTPTTAQPVSPSPSEAPQPSTSATPTTTYIAIGTAIIIIVAAAAEFALKRRK